LNQFLGSFEAQEGRSIVFPNIYQHKVEPFSLLDPAKPGRRTIVAFFLCDPSQRIHSTADIPPQRADWLREELSCESTTSPLLRLPLELKDKIADYSIADKVILNREMAEEARAKLMEERSRFQVTQNG
jgi:hypothetical protein